jgi:hypothetical protein
MNSYLIDLGLTRDSWIWFVGKITSGALLLISGLLPLQDYLTPHEIKGLTVVCAIVLWFSGHYDSSPLPAGKK